jgi:hypothetical protein
MRKIPSKTRSPFPLLEHLRGKQAGQGCWEMRGPTSLPQTHRCNLCRMHSIWRMDELHCI